MSKKMLIDAAHREETRVVVADGNNIEDFDFESEAKKQIKGNIYLARVTRVEPSLQAAFVEYGGNRHGFMAFSEVHPDYYQIPVADRERLLALQAEAEAKRTAAENAMDEEKEEDADGEDKPRGRGRRRSRRRPRSDADKSAVASEDGVEEDVTSDDQENTEETVATDADSEEAPETTAEEAPEEVSEEEVAEETAAGAPLTEEEAEAESKSVTALLKSAGVQVLALEDADLDNVEWTDEERAENEAEAVEDEDEDDDDIEPLDPALEEVESFDEDEENGDEDDTEASDDEEANGEADEISDEAADDESADADGETESDADGEGDKSSTRRRRGGGRRGGRDRGGRGGRSSSASNENGRSGGGRGGRSGGGRSNGGGRGGRGGRPKEDLDQDPRPFFKNYKIQEVVRRRQVMLVQVVKEERGNKGAALTTYLSLAGRYCVLMPNTARGGGISRKITNMSDRRRLKTIVGGLEVPKGMGLIVRTAGANRTKAEIRRDYDYLIRLWESIRDLTLKSSAPSMIHEEANLIKRSIRDLYSKDLDEVLVEGETAYKEAKAFMRMLMPSHARNVKLYTERMPLFQRHQVDVPLENMLSPRVDMPSGGYIIINQTEALVAVDVNSGRSTREHNIEDTAVKTNLEAADEVARQLRMRDLAGLIVIDFIDMEENRNNRAVERRLKDALQHDRARLQVGRISNFGLLEMSRQRLRAGILEGSTRPCPHCEGAGIVRSVESSALRILRACGEEGGRERSATVTVATNRETAEFLLNHKRRELLEFEELYGMRTIITVNRDLFGDDFELNRGEPLSAARRQEIQGNSAVSLDSAYLAEEEAKDAEAEARAQAEDEAIEAETKETPSRVKAKSDDKSEAKPEAKSDDESDGADEAEAKTDEDEEDGSTRRRRRGRRGGKRNRRRRERSDTDAEDTVEGATEGEAATTETSADADSTVEAVSEKASSDTDKPADEDKPKPRARRRTRSRTKNEPEAEATTETTSDDAASGDTAEAKTEEAAPEKKPARKRAAPKRKTAARKPRQTKAAATADISETVDAGEAPAAPKAVEPAAPREAAPATASEAGAETGDESGGKKGWWQRMTDRT